MRHQYTEQEKQFVLDHLREYNSYSDFLEVFNRIFSTRITVTSIRDLCTKRLHYGIDKNSGQYKLNHRDKSVPLGTIRTSANGCTYVKVSDTMTKFSGYSEPDWIPLQKKIYQDAYGKIKKGEMICFLDGDHKNFNLDNLYCINRRIAIRMAQNHWWSNNRNITLAGIKCIELQIALSINQGEVNKDEIETR